MTIYVIRHGETECNRNGIIQFPDDQLSEQGRHQAERLGARLADVGIGRIVASDFPRALATAEFVQTATGAPLQLEPLLRERDFGDLRGSTVREVGDLYRADLAPPAGEDWSTFHARVARAWQAVIELAENAAGHLAVVTHGMVCYSLAQTQWTLAPDVEIPRPFVNTSVSEVEPTEPWLVQVLNCGAHLGELGKRATAPAT